MDGRVIRLEPLDFVHVDGLWRAAQDADIWRWLPAPAPRNHADLERIVRAAMTERDDASRIPFAVVEKASGRAVGSTSYLDIEPLHRRIEIGWTWFGRSWWGTGVNEESKLLLFSHAFDNLRTQRVSLKTDARNERSQRAIERVGGVREGTLRKHYVRPDGTSRDTVYFSVIDTEWPQVRESLQARVARL
jgi:RimJ/RimL family protein N-acetyltransferase